jgi:hypothetical protein
MQMVRQINATFTPDDGRGAWAGQLRETEDTQTTSIDWDEPEPVIDWLGDVVHGVLEIQGSDQRRVYWHNGRFINAA